MISLHTILRSDTNIGRVSRVSKKFHVTTNRNSFQDLHTVDLEEFRHGGTNITAFRLVDPEKPEIQKVIQDWIYGEKRYNRELDMGQNSNKVSCASRAAKKLSARYNRRKWIAMTAAVVLRHAMP